MTTYSAIGIDDSVNTCDCCGKSNLKSTVVMQSSEGEIFHYGSTCATRNTGKVAKVIKQEIDALQQSKILAACAEYYASVEDNTYKAKLQLATQSGIRPGKDFMEFCKAESDIAQDKKRAIAQKYNIEVYSF